MKTQTLLRGFVIAISLAWGIDSRADDASALPVDSATTPCLWLDARPADAPCEIPAGISVAHGLIVTNNADSVVFSKGSGAVFRKAGHSNHVAVFQFKIPAGTPAGTYDIWTYFTLGGVSPQNFTIRTGPDPEHLEQRTQFRQKNAGSWRIAWGKGSTQITLNSDDRWIEIETSGMASQQRQFAAFLLVFETPALHNRHLVETMRSPKASRQLYVLEEASPEKTAGCLQYFAEHKDHLQDKVSVVLPEKEEARLLAASAGVTQLPALVATTQRGFPLASLPLPATPEELDAFVNAAPTLDAIVLEAGAKSPTSASFDGEMPVLYGVLTTHTAHRIGGGDASCNLIITNGNTVAATLRYEIPVTVKPALYDVWTSFTLGGLADQTFMVRVGSDPDHLQIRATFKQRNPVSWASQWQRASAQIKLYPGDRVLEIHVDGKSYGQKILNDFMLVSVSTLPNGVTPENAQWRSEAEGIQASMPQWRINVFESGDAQDANPFFKQLAQRRASLADSAVVNTFLGSDAQALATKMNLPTVAALVVMDERHTLRGVLHAPVDEDAVSRFLVATLSDAPAPGPFPKRAPPIMENATPLNNGFAASWLVVDGWAGRAGLSLWGLETESRIRPNLGDPCLLGMFDRGLLTNWVVRTTSDDGRVIINPGTKYDWSWSRGVAYAHLYLENTQDTEAVLRLAQTGNETQGWLDGEPLSFSKDKTPPSAFAHLAPQNKMATVESTNDQGGNVIVSLGQSIAPQEANLTLSAGPHRLLIKFISQQAAGQPIAFAAQFTTPDNKPITTEIQTRQNDSVAARDIARDALRLTPQVSVDAPANLPHPGDPVKLRFDLRYVNPRILEKATVPVVPFDAKLVLVVTDYDGKEMLRREVVGRFPTIVDVDLGQAPETGYYAIQPALYTPDGQLIHVYPPNGFSVVRGTSSQFARRDQKKMAVTYYFMGTGTPATYQTAFPWMTRMGIYRNIGSSPDFPLDVADAAKAAGIALSMDFWDMNNSYTQQNREQLAAKAASYTRWSKSFNEVDIHKTVRMTPEKWAARSKGEYRAVKQARPDAFFVGGSLVRPGSDDWFTDCLKLGLADTVDAWDVHAYPQNPPVLEGSLSNSPKETELGVQACYQRLGKTNTKPFWIGETGARCTHGADARRWQADMIAKMVACVCSRQDFQFVGFLWPWNSIYTGKESAVGDISAAHMPGEASYYTASALIDGFPYTRLDFGPDIQAARFGETRILWTTGAPCDVQLPLDGPGPWVTVDVIGRVRDLPTDGKGRAQVSLSISPIYVLRKAVYDRLTQF